jgi:hypothetical protein
MSRYESYLFAIQRFILLESKIAGMALLFSINNAMFTTRYTGLVMVYGRI